MSTKPIQYNMCVKTFGKIIKNGDYIQKNQWYQLKKTKDGKVSIYTLKRHKINIILEEGNLRNYFYMQKSKLIRDVIGAKKYDNIIAYKKKQHLISLKMNEARKHKK